MTLPCRSLALATLLVPLLWITVSLAEESPASWTEREQHRYSSELQKLYPRVPLAALHLGALTRSEPQ